MLRVLFPYGMGPYAVVAERNGRRFTAYDIIFGPGQSLTLLLPARALPLVVRRQLTPILQAMLVLEMFSKDR